MPCVREPRRRRDGARCRGEAAGGTARDAVPGRTWKRDNRTRTKTPTRFPRKAKGSFSIRKKHISFRKALLYSKRPSSQRRSSRRPLSKSPFSKRVPSWTGSGRDDPTFRALSEQRALRLEVRWTPLSNVGERLDFGVWEVAGKATRVHWELCTSCGCALDAAIQRVLGPIGPYIGDRNLKRHFLTLASTNRDDNPAPELSSVC